MSKRVRYGWTVALVAVAAGGTLALAQPANRGAQWRTFRGDFVYRNSWPAEPVNGQVIERVRAVCRSSCIWFGRPSTSGTVRDAELTRDGPSGARQIDSGIRIGGTQGNVPTTGVLIERVYSHGWRQVAHRGYANGDGIAINRSVGTVTIRDSRFDDNADAGVDTKADTTILDRVSAANNGHYGFRFWGGVRATTLTCTNNAWGCIQVLRGGRVTVDRLVMTGDQELVTTETPDAVVEIRSCDLSRWTGDAATRGPGQVVLGPTCRPRT